MNKNPVNYQFKYVNNSETLMLFWISADKEITHKIYVGDGSGEFRPAGSIKANYFITDAENVKEAYIEAYSESGEYISTSQIISVKPNSEEIIKITAVKSYNGVMLSWFENDLIGNYYAARKIDGTYYIQGTTNMPQLTINNMKDGDTIKIISFKSDEEGVTPLKISSEFVFSEDKLAFTAPEAPKVSVVIPVYNNEKFMVRCIDSVLSSSLKELEAIIVDDGSTDNSPAIADWYRDNYPGKVTVIHTENKGAAHARNEGIEIAKGEYIAFADSDDVMSSAMYRVLYERAEQYSCDISTCSYMRLMKSAVFFQSFPFEETGAYNIDWLLSVTYAKNYKVIAIWNKIYKTSLVKEHPIPELKYEDSSWTPIIYSYAKNFCYTRMPLYCYERTINKEKPTLSNEFAKLPPLERAVERSKAYETGLAQCNQEKRAFVLQIYVRIIVIHLLRNNPEDVMFQYVSFLLIHKNEIISNEHICKDVELAKLLDRIFAQFVLNEEEHRIEYRQ